MEEIKPGNYYGLVRNDVLELLPKNLNHILDLGCGEGYTGYQAKLLTGAQVVGVEIQKNAYEAAKKRLDKVILGDIEALELDFPDGYFDCIICADVFEHLKNPWAVLDKVKIKLTSDGKILASFPNIQYISVILKILRDRFEYEEFGILDNTHLRFFTLYTIKKFFIEHGFELINIKENRNRGWQMNIFNLFTLGLLRKFSVSQYIVLAQKIPN